MKKSESSYFASWEKMAWLHNAIHFIHRSVLGKMILSQKNIFQLHEEH